MSKKLYLHIGMDKTGTSAIQKFLVDNSALLENKYKTYYLKSGQSKDYAHNDLAYALFEQNGKDFNDLQRYLGDIELEISGNDCERFIISSECLFKAYKSKNYGFFIELLRKNFTDIYLIVYIRNQFEWIKSRHKHSITSGQTLEIDKLITPWFCDYKVHIDEWKVNLGLSQAKIRVYDKCQFLGGSIYIDFLDALGIDIKDENFSIPRSKVNDSLDDECIEIKKAINCLDISISEKNSFNDNLFQLSSLRRDKNTNSYFDHKQIEYIRLKYDNINKTLLSENKSKYKLDLYDYSIDDWFVCPRVPKDLVSLFVESLNEHQINLIVNSNCKHAPLIMDMIKIIKNNRNKDSIILNDSFSDREEGISRVKEKVVNNSIFFEITSLLTSIRDKFLNR